MYFNVYSDTGAEIHGYLIPDGFSAKPSVVVKRQGQLFGPFECDIFLEGPYKHKHHQTGVVGFNLNDGKVPGLIDASDIEVADAETGFVFYRRFDRERHIEKRLFRLETQFVPHRELDQSLKPHFQFHADGVERFGSETVRQMLEIANQPSTYVSGRVMLKSLQQYFTQDTIRITSLRDPFYELAIRLWSIASFKRRRFSFVSERDAILFEPAMAYFADTNFSDPVGIKSKVKSAPKDILALFESPFTHQLVASSPTDKVSRDAVSTALDVLSQFTIFSPNEADASLATDIGEFLAISDNSVLFSPMRSPFLELSDLLRSINLLEHVLENDLILFHFIRKAEHRSRDGAI
ncbi:hypothetical protein [Sinorhizobium sp. NFACC03]|uniref:hypothetical protein n=1 Tax=Sinorhizobium sp. NFACC03 TaxID=1566295 RepID=UPI000888F606|nr:hypothetical protein [Sinorhizobium sp. NFACC03]SDA99463.1 hypothetical protein SAMN03159448_06573 [Sinorhizobium sp. NFACC03]